MVVNTIFYDSYQQEIVELRRHFHTFPELSMEEKATADYVEKYLQKLGLQTSRVGEYGVTAMVWAPENIQSLCKTVAIRAEMDAIAVNEENNLPWKSQKDGVMHACGHDAIVASGLVLAKLCLKYREHLPVNVKFIFQPAEENGKGTQLMLDGGVMEQPKVDYFTMFHYVNDAPSGVELHRGASSAAIGSVKIKIKGQASHWCSYQEGADTIAGAGEVIRAITKLNQSYQSSSPFILGIGTISGGTAKNVVAGETVLEGSLRACRMKDYDCLRKLFLKDIEKIQEEFNLTIEVEIDQQPVPPIINDDELVDLGLAAGVKVWGEHCRLVTTEYLSGDSAAYYFDYAKGIFFIFTAKKSGEKAYPLHNGKFDIDETVLWKSVSVLHQFLLEFSDKKE
ncbi:M20 family metallopeptidase [Paenibacillus sp. CMAA1739]|uniref:M20 metallopeptidase family protein n=1 Tax=Paenibacillus ottowii TaxID=2315729 RepID=UPI0027301911|nr:MULTISPECIES: M20 family metallopeptidase [Paenibacillus]MDP1513378.1 M20 family metallopeptidase [Paenibacillus ottowii]MEC4569428.1 M20 family metallopeptidase [Paenibacillus sp. CMAA1739]